MDNCIKKNMSDKNLNTVSKDQAQTPAFMRPSAGT
jgi:hypothetical protein